jgi:hypothetical protein
LQAAASAVAATVGQRKAFPQRGLEDGLVVVDDELVPAGLNGDLMRHDVGLKCSDKPSDYHLIGRGIYPWLGRVTGR